jgi:2-(3-amino-3-carboxypropyl)histidine synthase
MAQYDLELENAITRIKNDGAKLVCVQLPEGLRPQAKDIVAKIKEETDAQPIIWLGSCYGACDVPVEIERLGVDLLIQWGHSSWS